MGGESRDESLVGRGKGVSQRAREDREREGEEGRKGDERSEGES
jgi:hypothetical protein